MEEWQNAASDRVYGGDGVAMVEEGEGEEEEEKRPMIRLNWRATKRKRPVRSCRTGGERASNSGGGGLVVAVVKETENGGEVEWAQKRFRRRVKEKEESKAFKRQTA